MTLTAIHTLCFSPTGTSRRIAAAIAQGAAIGKTTIHETELTYSPAVLTLPSNILAIFAIPVYGGHPAPLAMERIAALHGEGTPAVVIAVYGNRDIGGAAQELAEFVTARGFVTIAAGAFVGEHSYSSPATPIAAGRPDTQDLLTAKRFGAAIAAKLTQSPPAPVNTAQLRAPRTPLWPLLRFIGFVIGYRRAQKRRPVVLLPQTDAACCTHCGLCAAKCPAGAITRGEEQHTQPAKCIRCNACVKLCPVGARSFNTPFAPQLARNFSRRKEAVVLL